MNSPQQLYEQMESYLNGSMKGKERTAFETKIQQHQRLAIELESFQLLHRALRSSPTTHSPRRRAVNQQVLAEEPVIPEAIESAPRESKRSVARYIGAIAAIILLFCLAIYSVNFLKPRAHADLYNAYFKPVTVSHVDTSSAMKQEWTQAAAHLTSRNYSEAIPLLTKISQQSPNRDKHIKSEIQAAHFYLGVCHLAMDTDDPKKVVYHLEKADIPQSEHHLSAQWYMGLAYLKFGNIDKARGFFDRLSSQDSFANQERLGQLISDLR